MNDGLMPSRAEMVAKLYPAWQAREARNQANKDDALFKEQFLQWAGLEGETELYDNEHGIRAWKTESPRQSWDLRDASPDLVIYLAKEGLLDVKNTAFNQRRKDAPSQWLDLALKHRHEGVIEVTHIEKVD